MLQSFRVSHPKVAGSGFGLLLRCCFPARTWDIGVPEASVKFIEFASAKWRGREPGANPSAPRNSCNRCEILGGFFGATWHFLDIVREDSLAGVGRCSIQCHRVDLESRNAGVLNFVPWNGGGKRSVENGNYESQTQQQYISHQENPNPRPVQAFPASVRPRRCLLRLPLQKGRRFPFNVAFFELLCGAEPNCIRCSSTFRSHFHDSGAYEDSTMLGASVLGEALGFSQLQGPLIRTRAA